MLFTQNTMVEISMAWKSRVAVFSVCSIKIYELSQTTKGYWLHNSIIRLLNRLSADSPMIIYQVMCYVCIKLRNFYLLRNYRAVIGCCILSWEKSWLAQKTVTAMRCILRDRSSWNSNVYRQCRHDLEVIVIVVCVTFLMFTNFYRV